MKIWSWLVTLLLSTAVLITFCYIVKDPPLKINGVTTFTIPENDLKLSIVVENNGIEKVKIKEILINGTKKPERTAIGVGNRLVLGDIENPRDFSFHSFKDISILPLKEITGRGNWILLNYGVVIWNDGPVDSVEIRYTYLGIPFSLEWTPTPN